MRRALIAAVILAVLSISAIPAQKAPKPCIKALDVSEQIAEINADFAFAVSDFFSEVQEAAEEGGATGDVDAFLDTLGEATDSLSAEMEDLTDTVRPLVASYNRASGKCRRAR